MHSRWQLKQIVTIDNRQYIDWCNCFGGQASLVCWGSVNSLITWSAEDLYEVENPLCFNDDTFGVNDADDLSFYEPYQIWVPRCQANLLQLWDDLGIPHKQKKQIFSAPLTIISILVDPNAMSMTLPSDAKHDLVTQICRFASYQKRKSAYHSKRAWQQLAGWIN